MQETLVHALHAQRGQIRLHWEALLRVERTTTPLAHPDSLVHLLDWAIDEVFSTLRARAQAGELRAFPPIAAHREECSCGRNPFLVFFIAGEQAMIEGLVLAQSEIPGLDAVSRDSAVSELYSVLRQLRHQEIESFCALCQYRNTATCTPVTPSRRATVPDRLTVIHPQSDGTPG
jgi:hypothetical protein